MKRVPLGRTGILVNPIGMGCEHLQGKDEALVISMVNHALDGGVNLLDVFMSEPNVRTAIGRGLGGRRDQAILQGHIGATWQNGQYAVSREPDLCRAAFEDLLRRLQTDYIDVAMLHFVDDLGEWDRLVDSDTFRYALSLKDSGAARCLGMSSHNPAVALRAAQSGAIDVIMFSVNPAYDLLPGDASLDSLFSADMLAGYQDARGVHPARAALYQTCERLGVAITVMKALGGGTLLDGRRTPLGNAMTVHQLMHYALSRPAVASVLVGSQTTRELEHILQYEHTDPDDLDYAEALTATPRYAATGRCMYCNHCLPCPAAIDIAQVNKYLDLAEGLPEMPATVAQHYSSLSKTAADCIECGACERRCPFGVPVIGRMRAATALFGG
ncbi:MAG: aldo/keto reductase [Clostridiales bacterium]|nr:aldo/keto reductase [Clostridiales bacterium]